MLSLSVREALQMLDAGWTVRYDPGLDAVHWRSPDGMAGACSQSLDDPPDVLVRLALDRGDIHEVFLVPVNTGDN
jgi:hypothetical protein